MYIYSQAIKVGSFGLSHSQQKLNHHKTTSSLPLLASLQFGRHKRQHGAHLYLPDSYVIPGGDGNPADWGSWGAPSECSRSCGGGVSYQTRECLVIE